MSGTTATERAEGKQETEFAIIINGELAVVPHDGVSYTEVVSIAYPVPPGPDTTYTVTFRKAKGPRHEGIFATPAPPR